MSGRVVPQHEATVPVTGLAELQAHLAELHQPGNESAPLDHKLFDDVELQLTPSNIPIIQPTLLPPLMSLLKTTTQDPTVVFTLTTKILSPLSFTQCLSLGGAESLISALQSPLPGANLLALNIIQKAATSPAEVDSLAASPDLVEELLRTWLSSPDADVGGRATRVLGSLLETDCDIIPETSATTKGVNGTGSSETELVKRHIPGHASLWRLVIWDRHYLEIIVSLCRPAIINRQATFAQDRLLRVIPRLTALHPRAMAISPFPELFPLPEYADDSIGNGLLQWASLSMVDTSDVLMHQTLIVFYESFVSIMRIAGESADKDAIVRNVVKTATSQDQELLQSLRTLPDRTVQEEAELLAKYISRILD
ncbi:Ff.00g105610.m01.CDS01 [Fusarium sp. VM40]|nr:Ff.00g105610.m01.CDS01 [Fusarium sp. VM40]